MASLVRTVVPRSLVARVRQSLWRSGLLKAYAVRTMPPEGDAGVALLGHRGYVGTDWEAAGRRQLDFLVRHGLQPSDVLLDIACGSLRGGVHVIPYLLPGHYLGVDKEPLLLERGIEEELGRHRYETYRPELLASDSFEFERLSKRPTKAIAVSLFTHLSGNDIRQCLSALRRVVDDDFALFATFSLTSSSRVWNPSASHAHAPFEYREHEVRAIAADAGFEAATCPDWGDASRHGTMFRFTPRPAP